MNTIKELKAKEKYDNMLKRKNKEIERLNKENTILRQNSQYLVKQKDELEELINKAIEYINTMPLTKGTEWYRIQLLDILTGDDKE